MASRDVDHPQDEIADSGFSSEGRLGGQRKLRAALIVGGLLIALVILSNCVAGGWPPTQDAGDFASESSLRLYFCSEVTARSAEQNASKAGADPRKTSGNNDCILLEYEDGEGEAHHALVDTGNRWENADGTTVTLEWLRSHGVKRLEWMLLTHQHGDHMEEAASILRTFDVGTLYMKHYDGAWVLHGITDEDSARKMLGVGADVEVAKTEKYCLGADGLPLVTTSSSSKYAEIARVAVEAGTKVVGPSWAEMDPGNPVCATASPALSTLKSWTAWVDGEAPEETPSLFEAFDAENTEFAFGPADIKVVNWREYDANGEPWSETSSIAHETVISDNQNSLGVVLEVGSARAFLAGDIECASKWHGLPKFPGEHDDEWLIAGEVGDVDFYKAAHHGSNTSSSDYLLESIKPEACMITNMVDKASTEVVERLERHGCACIMYTTEDPAETIVEVAPNGVRMKRASDDGWAYSASVG